MVKREAGTVSEAMLRISEAMDGQPVVAVDIGEEVLLLTEAQIEALIVGLTSGLDVIRCGTTIH